VNKPLLLKIALGGGVLVAITIQFVPVDRTNPPVTREIRWDSEATASMARASCYDCHSNETEWPWYGALAPASWLVAKDVREARDHLNFSTWDLPNEDMAGILEMVEDGEMPLRKYTLMHPEARLDDEARAALVRGLRATLEADPPVSGDDHEEGDDDHAHS
jgi:Haem-binding domain